MRQLQISFYYAILMMVCGLNVQARSHTPDYPGYFEKYTKQDRFDIDTTANAVILYESVNYAIELAGPNYIMRKHVRRVIKIVTDEAKHMADIHEYVRNKQGGPEGLSDLKAVTYNWQNNVMTEDRVDKDAIAFDRADKHYSAIKFSMPSVRAGSVIDYQYSVDEPLYLELGTEYFQSRTPKLYSEVGLNTSSKFSVSTVLQGSLTFKEINKDDEVAELSSLTCYKIINNNNSHWVVRNMPGYTEEPFVANVKNYLPKISFQLANNGQSLIDEDNSYNTWEKIDKFYLENDKYLKRIKPHASYIQEALLTIAGKDTSRLVKAMHIYKYVRDSFNIVNTSTSDAPLQSIFEKRAGNERELNMLFIAFLRAANIECHPILMATTRSVQLTKVYPVLQNIDHIATLIVIGSSKYVADPSGKYLPFGTLSPECYNGYCRVVDVDRSYGISLEPYLLSENEKCVVTTKNADPGEYTLTVTLSYGNVRSPKIKEHMMKSKEWLKNEISKNLPPYAELVDYKVLNSEDAGDKVTLEYDIKMPWTKAAMYISPIVARYFSANPFKQKERNFPVEFPCSIRYDYTAEIKVPNGYKLMDITHSANNKYRTQNEYNYDASFDSSGNTLKVQTAFVMKETFFDHNEYAALRSFFDKILELEETPYYFKKQ